MRAHPKKKKSEIPYIDIRDDNYRVNNYKGNDIPTLKVTLHLMKNTHALTCPSYHLLRDLEMRGVSFSMTKTYLSYQKLNHLNTQTVDQMKKRYKSQSKKMLRRAKNKLLKTLKVSL